MAVRYETTFQSDKGWYYKVQIHDTNYTGNTYDFNMGENRFELSYEEVDTDRYNPILTSKVKLELVVSDFNKDRFLAEAVYSEENQFSLVIYRGTSTSSYDLFWVGYLLPDMITIPDEDYHSTYVADLNFYDTLSLSKDMFISTTPEKISFKDFLVDNLALLQIADYYQSTDHYLSTKVNWFDAQHSTVSSLDPLKYTRFNTSVFITGSNSSLEAKSVYDCFLQICKAWNARLFFWEGVWHFEQINEFGESGTYEAKYKKNGDYISKVTDVSAVGLANGDKLGGASSDFLPAFKTVLINYNYMQGIGNNILPSQTTYNSWTQMGSINGSSESLQMRIKNAMFINYSGGTSGEAFRAKFRMYVKLDQFSGSDYYMNYESPFFAWNTNSASYVEFVTPVFTINAGTGFTAHYMIDLLSEIIPSINFASSQFKFQLYGYERLNLSNQWVSFTPSGTFDYSENFYVSLKGSTSETDGTITNRADNNNSSGSVRQYSEIYERDSVFGDGPTSISAGKLETADYTLNWADATEWKRDAVPSGDGVNFNTLAAIETLAGQKEIRELYNGTIRNKYLGPKSYFNKSWYTTTSKFCFLSGTLNARWDEWQGIWFEQKFTRTNIDTERILNPNIDPAYMSNGNTNMAPPDNMMQNQFINLISMFSLTNTSAAVSGTKTSISINSSSVNLAKSGEDLVILNPYNLQYESFTLSADMDSSDTSLSISSKAFANSYPPGSFIVQTLKQIRGLARNIQDA